MTYRYPILSAVGLSVVVWGVFCGLRATGAPLSETTQPPQPASDATSVEQPTPPLATPGDGQRLLRAARESLSQHSSISAKVRVKGASYGKEYVGSGVWLQGSPASNFLRYELKFRFAERDASLQQVCDGQFLWLQRQFEQLPVLGRIDVQRVLSAAPPTLPTPGIGGLPRLLEGLDLAFQFDDALEGTLKSTDVWVLKGQWRRDRLVKLLPDQKAQIEEGNAPRLEKLAPALPDHVIVLLGRDDLFPHRIEYCRTRPNATSPATKGSPPSKPVDTISKIEFLDPKFDLPVDPRLFHFEAGGLPVADETDLYIQAINPAG